jgi:hypothetical protein
MLRRLLRPTLKVAAIGAVIAMIPVAAFAGSGYFTSSSGSTPAVKAVNSSTSTGAAGVVGEASANSSNQRYGVDGYAIGTGGIGVWGAGAKYGVYSNGNLGVATGKTLRCGGCVTSADLATSARRTVTVQQQGFVAAGDFAHVEAYCPSGYQATGGGVAPNNVLYMEVTRSTPIIDGGVASSTGHEATGWSGAVRNDESSGQDFFYVTAICAPGA